MLEVLAALRRAAGLGDDELQPEFAPARLGELQRSALDVEPRAGRARVHARRPASTTGMRRTLEWARAAAAARPSRVAGPARGTGEFYEEAYAPTADAERHGRWRALSARRRPTT